MRTSRQDPYALRSAAEDRIFDLCIIGSGAAGSVIAGRAVHAGLSTVLLEQGTTPAPGVSYWDAVAAHGLPALARDDRGKWSTRGRAWTGCNLGGGTVYYGAAAFRLRETDFDSSEFFQTDMDLRWPIRYRDLAPYYDRVESDLRVARDDDSDPTAPSMPPGLPPVPPSVAATFIREGALRLGLRPFGTPLAINTVDEGRRGLCTRCSGCIDVPCPTGAKADAYSVWVVGIVENPGLTLLDRMRAAFLLPGRGDRIRSVECLDLACGARRHIRARFFALAGNAVQSSALLLRSASRVAPAGIGNEHDMVGRGLCLKLSAYVGGYVQGVRGLKPSDLHGPFSTVSVTDYYHSAGSDGQPGGLIYESKSPVVDDPPSVKLCLRLEAILADRPCRRNRVRLMQCDDPHGLPVVALDYRTSEIDRVRLKSMKRRCNEILVASGASDVQEWDSEYYLGSGHLHGGCRAGANPRDSVVDGYGKVHSLDNLYVADGGFMPYPGGVNPTLTIQANALRIADHLIERAARPSEAKL